MQFLRQQDGHDGLFDQVGKLPIKSRFHFFITGKGFWILFCQSNFFACQSTFPLIKGKFQGGCKANVRCLSPFSRLPEMRYNTATIIPVPCIFWFISCINQHLIACAIVMNCREASTLAHQMGHCI